MTTAIVILNNLASKGDAIAAHTLDQNIRLWIKKGSYQVRRCTLHVCRHRIVDVGLIKELLHDEDIWQDALKLLNRRADRGDIDAIRVLQAEITTCIKERNYSFLRKIISTCRTCIQDQDMIEILLDDEHTSDIMAEILYYRARDGDKAAIDLLLSALRVHVLDRNSSAHYMILHNAQHFITDHGLIQQLLQDDKAKTTAIQILRDLASKGDAVAARTLDDNIENWIENGSLDFRRTVFHICKDRIMDLRLIQMFIRDDRTKREALELIKLRADQGNDDAARLLDAIITDQIGKGTYDAIWGILSLCPDMLWNKGLLDSFIKKDVWFHYLMSFLQEQARKGDERAATKFKEIIEAMIPEFFTGGDYLHMIRALPRTKME
nr:hypothetical protein [Candidatus Sigynarchaeota archaeon]